MKKLFINLVTILSMSLAALGAPAANIDLGAIELGKIYTIPDYASVTGTITPTVTGKLMQDGVADIKIQGVTDTWAGYGQYGQVYSYEVEAGKTYTVSCDFVMSGGKVVFYQEGGDDFSLDAISILPEAGSIISPVTNLTGEVLIKFNSEVIFDAAYLVAGTENIALVNSSIQSNTLAFNVADALNTFYDNGAISKDGGTKVTLQVIGLQTESGVKYDGSGVMSLDYVTSPKLATLVSATNCANGTPFKSYYLPTDPAAELTFTFDSDIAPGAFLSIGAGSPELDSYMYEEIPCEVDGKIVKCSLAGKLRNFTSVISNGDFVSVQLCNVKDTYGNYAQAAEGMVGSYAYTFTYDYIQPIDITAEFVPASGASLAGVNALEIAFNHADKIFYGGVCFTYEDAEGSHSVKVPAADCKVSVEDGWATINVNKPAELEGKKAITVNLYDVECLDGYDHTAAIQAEYDKFVVTLIGPYTQGAVIDRTGDDDWVITCNTDPGYLRYDFYNKVTSDSPDGWYGGAEFHKQDDGTWTAYNLNVECFSNFRPYMRVRAYNEEMDYWNNPESAIGEYVITFEGSNRPFTYSTIKFVSVTPENNSTIAAPVEDDFCFTVQFDGLVTLDPNTTGISEGFGSTSQFERIEAVGQGEGDDPDYAHTWKLYPGALNINSRQSIDIFVKAFDLSGFLVEGNVGGEEYDYLSFTYIIDNPESLVKMDIFPEGGSVVTSLSFFTLSVPGKSVTINYNYTGEQRPVIYNMFMEEVYVFTDDDIEVYNEPTGEEDEFGYPIYNEVSVVNMFANADISTPGRYMLYIPATFFNIGDQFDVRQSEELWASYSIGGDVEKDLTEITTDPAPGEVSSLERIEFLAPNIQNAMCNGDGEVTVSNEQGEVLFSEQSFEISMRSLDWNTWTFIGFYIEPGITDEGVYILNVPQGFFEFEDMSVSAAFNAVYTVTTTGIKVVGVDKADRYDVYTLQGVRVLSTSNAADLKVLGKGIYIINGRKVMVK